MFLVSKEPERLVDFYERAFGLKFAREDHDDMDVHYGAFIGSVHLGIHPPTNFPEGPETGEGGLILKAAATRGRVVYSDNLYLWEALDPSMKRPAMINADDLSTGRLDPCVRHEPTMVNLLSGRLSGQ